MAALRLGPVDPARLLMSYLKLDFNIGGLSHGVLFIGNKYDCGFDTSCQERLMMM